MLGGVFIGGLLCRERQLAGYSIGDTYSRPDEQGNKCMYLARVFNCDPTGSCCAFYLHVLSINLLFLLLFTRRSAVPSAATSPSSTPYRSHSTCLVSLIPLYVQGFRSLYQHSRFRITGTRAACQPSAPRIPHIRCSCPSLNALLLLPPPPNPSRITGKSVRV